MPRPVPDPRARGSYAKIEDGEHSPGDPAWGELKIESVTSSGAVIRWPVFSGSVDIEYRLTFYSKGGNVASQWYFCPGFKPTEDIVDVVDNEMTLQVDSLSADSAYNLVLCVRNVTGSMQWTPQLRAVMTTLPAVPDVMVEVAARFGSSGVPLATATVPVVADAAPQRLFVRPYPSRSSGADDAAAHGAAATRAAAEGYVAAEHAVDATLYGTRATRNYEVSKHGGVIAHGDIERITASARSASFPRYPKYEPVEEASHKEDERL